MDKQIVEQTMKMLQLEAAEVFLAEIGYDFLNESQRKAIDAAVNHALNHALEEGIIQIPVTDNETWSRSVSLTYECPTCHSEVDLREARAL